MWYDKLAQLLAISAAGSPFVTRIYKRFFPGFPSPQVLLIFSPQWGAPFQKRHQRAESRGFLLRLNICNYSA